MRRTAFGCAAGLIAACATSGAKSLPDGGVADSGIDGGTPDSGGPDGGLFALPVYGTGAVALTDAGCPPLPAQPDLLDTILALADAGLNRCNLDYPSDWHMLFALPDGGGGIDDAFVLPYFNQLHDHPLLVPSFASNLSNDLDSAGQSSHPVSESLAALAARLGITVTASDPTLIWAPEADPAASRWPMRSGLLGANAPDGGWPDDRRHPTLPAARCATLLGGLSPGALGSNGLPRQPAAQIRPDPQRAAAPDRPGRDRQAARTKPQRPNGLCQPRGDRPHALR